MKIPQSTTKNLMVLMVDEADHLTGLAGLTLTITASKDGAAFASISPTVTDRGDGWYNIALTAAHTNTTGDLALHVTGALADPLDLKVEVVDANRGILLALPAAAAEAAGGLFTRGTGAGQINQAANGMIDGNVVRWLGTAAAAPAVAGIPKVEVGSIAAGVLTAAAIADGAITAAKFAADAITSTVIADNAITAGKIATAALTSAKFAADAITSTVLADGAITAGKLASNAIAAAKIATDALTAITASNWNYAHITARTTKGVMKRLDQYLTGKATGLIGSTFAIFDTDGVTKLVEAAQDTAAGTRTAASTVAGD